MPENWKKSHDFCWTKRCLSITKRLILFTGLIFTNLLYRYSKTAQFWCQFNTHLKTRLSWKLSGSANLGVGCLLGIKPLVLGLLFLLLLFSVLIYYEREVIPQYVEFFLRELPIRCKHVHLFSKKTKMIPWTVESNFDNLAKNFSLGVG